MQGGDHLVGCDTQITDSARSSAFWLQTAVPLPRGRLRGETIDSLLTSRRDTEAAKRFFRRGLAQTGQADDQRREKPFLSGGGREPETGRYHPPALPVASVQIPE